MATSFILMAMFEEAAASAAWFLTVLFWIIIALIMAWGTLWIWELRKTRSQARSTK